MFNFSFGIGFILSNFTILVKVMPIIPKIPHSQKKTSFVEHIAARTIICYNEPVKQKGVMSSANAKRAYACCCGADVYCAAAGVVRAPYTYTDKRLASEQTQSIPGSNTALLTRSQCDPKPRCIDKGLNLCAYAVYAKPPHPCIVRVRRFGFWHIYALLTVFLEFLFLPLKFFLCDQIAIQLRFSKFNFSFPTQAVACFIRKYNFSIITQIQRFLLIRKRRI